MRRVIQKISLLLLNVCVLTGCAAKQSSVQEQSSNIVESVEISELESIENVINTESQTDAEIMEQPVSSQMTLLMVGDILLHTPVENAALQGDDTYNFNVIFENMKEDIQEADLAIVNQEVIIGGEELGISGYPAFNAPFAVGDALVEVGFDVVCHGTNHALDKGKKGLLNCIYFWKENYPDIAVLGIHETQESQDNIYIYEKDDIKLAVLNYTYGTNGIALPKDMPFAVDLFDEQKIISDIQKAEKLADFTIVCPHWGTEYQLTQSDFQEKWAKIFVENGVDLVLGTHPHVIQPIEWVIDEISGNEMLVYYSLGNFVNWTSESGKGIANRMVGGMAQIALEKGEDGQVHIAEYGVEPVVCHLEQGVNGVTVYKLQEYTIELAEKNQIRLQDSIFSKEYCEQLCEKVWFDIWKD